MDFHQKTNGNVNILKGWGRGGGGKHTPEIPKAQIR